MKTLLKERMEAFLDLQNEIFNIYPKEDIEKAVARLIVEVKCTKKVNMLTVSEALASVLNKTETYNVLLTLIELDKKVQKDRELLASMKDSAYNLHRTMALSICQLYGSGAISLFGFVDCKFRTFFPLKHPKSFLAKGICGLVSSAASLVISDDVKEEYVERNLEMLAERGVTMDDMAGLVYDLQKPYNPNLPYEVCVENIKGVLRKQQTYHTIQLCVKVDKGVETGEFGDQFTNIVGNDEGLYGIDEVANLTISYIYGSIGLTNFGFLDKSKPKIIGELDSDHTDGKCNTYLDDTICAIVSAACGRLAHNNVPVSNKPVYK